MPAVCATPSEIAAGRLAPLAVLPVFLNLAGRKVVVAGGDAAAAWKAELAAAAGADVLVLAPTEAAALVALRRRGVAAGSLTVMARAWTAADLHDAALAIASCDDEADAAAFHAAAHAAGVPANVVDRPAFSTVQFGSIVNRSPVVVGISTGGAAPVLAQSIRRRIETLLPPALATWAARAHRLRAEVARRLPDRARRRAYWNRFAEAAFGCGEEPAFADVNAVPAGHVALVGAGPGDPGLLTLNAVRAMQAADVILFDDLVSDEVLVLARREARKLLIGRRAGRQDDITGTMLRFARAGRRVVRLMTGDPAVLGQAEAEMARLRAAGIAVDLVPGITAAPATGPDPSTRLPEHGIQAKAVFRCG